MSRVGRSRRSGWHHILSVAGLSCKIIICLFVCEAGQSLGHIGCYAVRWWVIGFWAFKEEYLIRLTARGSLSTLTRVSLYKWLTLLWWRGISLPLHRGVPPTGSNHKHSLIHSSFMHSTILTYLWIYQVTTLVPPSLPNIPQWCAADSWMLRTFFLLQPGAAKLWLFISIPLYIDMYTSTLDELIWYFLLKQELWRYSPPFPFHLTFPLR